MTDSATFNSQTAQGAYGIYVLMQDGKDHFTVEAMKLSPDEANAFKHTVSKFGDALDPQKVIEAAKTMSDIDPKFLNPSADYFSGDATKESVLHNYSSAFSSAIDAYNDLSAEYERTPVGADLAGDLFDDNKAVTKQWVDVDMMISPMLDMARISPPADAGAGFKNKIEELEIAQENLQNFGGLAQKVFIMQDDVALPDGTPPLDFSQFEHDGRDETPSLDAASIKL